MTPVRYGLIVPTLNAGSRWKTFLASLEGQSLQPYRKLIIDSGSDDQTVASARQSGFEVLSIARQDFDHGGTRQQAVDALPDCEVILLLTQDSVLAERDSIEHLLRAFEQTDVGAAYGRQLPFQNATLSERHARSYNYPEQSQVKSLQDRARLGIKTAFISNTFAAYRRDALLAVGGFPSQLIFGEDTYIAGKLLLAQWKVAYCSDAPVFHSHNQSLPRVLSRSFDIGVLHSSQSWLLKEFRSPEGEGLNFVVSELKLFWSEKPTHILSPIFRNSLRFLAYRSGRLHRLLPMWFNRFFSMNRTYWKDE